MVSSPKLCINQIWCLNIYPFKNYLRKKLKLKLKLKLKIKIIITCFPVTRQIFTKQIYRVWIEMVNTPIFCVHVQHKTV